MLKAKEMFIPFEENVLDSDTALKKSKSELQALYLPLGKATYQAYLDGLIKNKRFLADRIAAQKHIDNLQQQYDRLTPDSDAGIAQKGKSKAQQLIIAGKMKIEEASFGKLEKKVGRQLIEESQEESVRCDLTIKMLDKIAFNRDEISKLTFENQVANKELGKIIKKLSEVVPLEQIENSKTFDAEYSFCETKNCQLKTAIEKETLLMIDALSEIEQNINSNSLVALLVKYKEHYSANKNVIKEANNLWESLKSRPKTSTLFAIVFVCIVLMKMTGVIQNNSLKSNPEVIPTPKRIVLSGAEHGEVSGNKDPQSINSNSSSVLNTEESAKRLAVSEDTSKLDTHDEFADLDYTVGPDGQDLKTMITPQTAERYATTNIYYETVDHQTPIENNGTLTHGPQTVWYTAATNGPKAKPKKVVYIFAGRKHGMQTSYFESGQIEWELPFRNGKEDGVERGFYESGKKRALNHYKKGLLNGESVEWNKDGTVSNNRNYKDGKLHGAVMYTYNSYTSDKQVQKHSFWENGKLITKKSSKWALYSALPYIGKETSRNPNTGSPQYQLRGSEYEISHLLGEPSSTKVLSTTSKFGRENIHYWTYLFSDGIAIITWQKNLGWTRITDVSGIE